MKKILRTSLSAVVGAIAFAGCDGGPPADSAIAQAESTDPIYASLAGPVRNPDDFATATDLAALLPTLGPEALPAVKRILGQAAEYDMGIAEYELLIHDWASHQPAEAAAFATHKTPRAFQVAAIYTTVTPWARANPRDALASERASVLKGQYRAAEQISLVRGWYESGQPGVEEYLRDLAAGIERQRALRAYSMSVIRKRGVGALVEWAEAVPKDDASYQTDVFRAVGPALVPFDLEAAKRFCDAHCEGQEDSELRSEIDSLTAAHDAPAATSPAAPAGPDLSYQSLVELIGDPDDFAKANRLGALLPKLGPGALPTVKRVLGEDSVFEMGGVEFELLLRYWALHDPAEAGFYAITSAPIGYRVGAIHVAVPPWVHADPQKAVGTVKVFSMQGGDPAAAAQIALVVGWYDSGKPGLEDYIRDLGVGFERQRSLRAYSTSVIRKRGAKALVEWAEAVPEDDASYKLDVFRAVAPALVPVDLSAAKRFCNAHCGGPHGSDLRSLIAMRWIRQGATSAPLEWLASGPEGQDRNLAVRITYETWGELDRDGAIRWMKEQTAAGDTPAWLRPALPGYARLLAVDSPAEGLAWAARIDTQKESDVVTLEIAHAWRKKDEAAAEAWLRQSSLPPELQEYVRAPEDPLIRGNQRPYIRAGK